MVIHNQSANCSPTFTGLINSIWHFNCSWFGYSKVFNWDFEKFLSLLATRNDHRCPFVFYCGLLACFVKMDFCKIDLKGFSSPKVCLTGKRVLIEFCKCSYLIKTKALFSHELQMMSEESGPDIGAHDGAWFMSDVFASAANPLV